MISPPLSAIETFLLYTSLQLKNKIKYKRKFYPMNTCKNLRLPILGHNPLYNSNLMTFLLGPQLTDPSVLPYVRCRVYLSKWHSTFSLSRRQYRHPFLLDYPH